MYRRKWRLEDSETGACGRRQAVRPTVKAGAIWRKKMKTGRSDAAMLRSADVVNRRRQNASQRVLVGVAAARRRRIALVVAANERRGTMATANRARSGTHG
jgi:hypothetical protein